MKTFIYSTKTKSFSEVRTFDNSINWDELLGPKPEIDSSDGIQKSTSEIKIIRYKAAKKAIKDLYKYKKDTHYKADKAETDAIIHSAVKKYVPSRYPEDYIEGITDDVKFKVNQLRYKINC